jgi:hypothetical protein
MAPDPQRQTNSDAHILNDNYQGDAIGPYQDGLWVTSVPPRYEGGTINAQAAGRIYFSGDGGNDQITASGITPEVGLIRPWAWADLTTSTLPSALAVAPKCSSGSHIPPAVGADAGVGSSCTGIQPPGGARFIYRPSGTTTKAQALAHIASCGLDPYSAKYWNTLAVYGAVIVDTDPFTSGFSAIFESERDFDKYGYSNPYALIASTIPGSTFNQAAGTYSIPVSTGSGCINLSDLHFVDPGTVFQAGTVYPP